MKKEILKGFQFAFGFFLFFAILFGVVYAVGFHTPNEILAGTFLGNFIFDGNTSFNGSISLENLNSTTTYGQIYYKGPKREGVDSYTKLLLHADGTDGSTNFADDSNSHHKEMYKLILLKVNLVVLQDYLMGLEII